jgi:hypothetical protein
VVRVAGAAAAASWEKYKDVTGRPLYVLCCAANPAQRLNMHIHIENQDYGAAFKMFSRTFLQTSEKKIQYL